MERDMDRGQRERDMGRGERERDRSDRDQPRGERDRERGERERDRGILRDRDRDLRDSRDRIGRNGESAHFNHRRPTHGAWGLDVPERESDWNRRRNRNGSGGSHRDTKDKGGYFERRGHYRDREEEQEPEWFSGDFKQQIRLLCRKQFRRGCRSVIILFNIHSFDVQFRRSFIPT